MLRKYYLLFIFVGRRIYQTASLKVRRTVFAIPKKIHFFIEKIKFKFRSWVEQHFGENKDHLVDRYEYEVLKDKAEQRQKELEQSLALVRATLDSTADAILMSHKEGGLIDVNQKFMEMSGLATNVAAKKDEGGALKQVLNQMKDPVGLLELIKKVDENYEIKGFVADIETTDGRIFERYTQPIVVSGEMVGRVWSFRDITERKHSEEALRLRERAILASTHGIVITDSPNNNIIYVNPAFEKITGYNFSEVQGKNFLFLQNNDLDQPELKKIKLALKEQEEGQAELRNYRKDGTMFWNELHVAPVPNTEGKVTHYVSIIVDITERKRMEEQLFFQATHDALTNLPNRILLNDRISQGIINARRTKTILGIMFLDLDRFKNVNDTLGHNLGDHLLNYIAEKLSPCIRESDTLARMGGDEFIFIISNLKRHEDIIEIADNVLKTIALPMSIEGSDLNLTGSIGISFYPDDGQDTTNLIKYADLAMYRAKDLGRNNFQFYTKELSDKISRRVQIEHDLREAIERKEFTLYYQPITSLVTNQVIGAEALIRWHHPKGLISPDEFIGIAEDSGLIIPIGHWVLETACRQSEALIQQGLPIYISMNVSGKQFNQTDIAKQMEEILQKNKLNPNFLIIELTESVLMQKGDQALQALHELQKLGIKISIDDFGTGYSSFSYLYTFHVGQLKIDKSFVQGLPDNQEAVSIVLAILALAKQLGLKVVAEGIETKEQLDFLRQNGCDNGQGFYFSKPLPTEDFLAYIKKHV